MNESSVAGLLAATLAGAVFAAAYLRVLWISVRETARRHALSSWAIGFSLRLALLGCAGGVLVIADARMPAMLAAFAGFMAMRWATVAEAAARAAARGKDAIWK